MTSTDPIIGPLAGLLDHLVADTATRDLAKLELLRLRRDPVLRALLVALNEAADPLTSRARPAFLYVMYALLLWSVPLGLLAAVRPATAHAVAVGMTGYLAGIPEPLYALFGTGYLGYTVARSWGKARGVER